MKKLLLLVGCICVGTLASCIESQPNDRAMFNLQGQVKSLSMDNEDFAFHENIVFQEYTGMIDTDQSNYSDGESSRSRSYGHIEQCFEEEGTCLMKTYDFDKRGRLIRYRTGEGRYDASMTRIEGIDAAKSVEYAYKGKERLPYKQTVVTRNLFDKSVPPVTTEGEIEYSAVDDRGNWLVSKWNGQTRRREITYYDSLAGVDNCPMEKSVDWTAVGQVLLAIVLSLLFLAMIVHMVYENFFKRKLRIDCSAEEFSRLRQQAGLGAEATDEENTRAWEYTDEMYGLWSTLTVEDGDEIRAPLSRKVIGKSALLWQQAVDAKPTNAEIVDRINQCAEVINNVQKRTFAGSKTFLITSLVLATLLSFIGGNFNMLWMILFFSALYVLASMKPTFMQIKKELSGKGGKPKFMSAIIGGLFGAVATAKTYKTVTKWSDGTTTTDTDHSETWFTLIFGLVIMIVLALFMGVVALVNYLRNYILCY